MHMTMEMWQVLRHCKMFTLGHDFIRHPFMQEAGAMGWHHWYQSSCRQTVDSTSVYQNEVFDAAVMFARAGSIIPAPGLHMQ